MAENNEDKGKQDEQTREERLEKIKSMISGNGEDAAKVLKMWMNKEAAAKSKR